MSVDPRLGQRRQEVFAHARGVPVERVGRQAGEVGGDRGGEAEAPRRFDPSLHQHQGPADIRVVEQPRGESAGPGRAALLALERKGQRRLIGALGDADALDADVEAGGVHHHEHRGQALIRLADQFGVGVLVEHHAGRRSVDAELVLQPGGAHRVGFPKHSHVIPRDVWGRGTGSGRAIPEGRPAGGPARGGLRCRRHRGRPR